MATDEGDKAVSEVKNELTDKAPDSLESSSSEQTTPALKEPEPLRRQPVQRQGPTARDLMMAMGTSPRRLFLGTASATGIALAGNFLGVTSNLLTLIPEEALEPTGIDTYFPRGGCMTKNSLCFLWKF